MCPAFDEETDPPDLPRRAFQHPRRQQGRVRALIDRNNTFAPADEPDAVSTYRRTDGAELA